MRSRHLLLAIWMVVAAAAAQTSGSKMFDVKRASLCLTEGAVEDAPGNRLSIDAPKMRAYVDASTSRAIEARFTYLGETSQVSRLGSGAVRTQFGLKLQAQDACNLVYAMWRIEPENKIVVSVKRNQGQSRSSQCGNRGYRNIKPRHESATPSIRSGQTHTLRAELSGGDLRVLVDRLVVWEGDLGPDAAGLNGPVGIRSDNARLTLDLKAGEPLRANPPDAPACKSGADASD